MMSKEKQISMWIQKTKDLIDDAKDQQQRDYVAMMWLGYLNGLRLTNAIAYPEYKELYDEIQKFIAGVA